MVQPIGNLIVNLRMNGSEFASDLSRTSARTAAETRRMRTSLDGTTRSIENLRRAGHSRIIGHGFLAGARSLDSLTRRAEFLRATMLSLTAVFGGLSTALVANAVTAMADSYTNLNNQLKTVTKTEQERLLVEEALFNISQDTRTGLRENAVLFTRITRATDRMNLSLERRLDLTRTLQKGFIAGGATSQEASSAAIQLTQGLAADQLGGEELRALKETPLGALLAEGLGVAVGDLKEMGAAGELTAERIVAAFEKVAPKIDELFSRTQVSISQSLTRLDNAFVRYIGSQDKSLGATQMVANGLNALSENIDTVAESIIALTAAFGARWVGAAFGRNVKSVTDGMAQTKAALQSNVVQAQEMANKAGLIQQGYAAQRSEILKTVAAHKTRIGQLIEEQAAYRRNITIAREQQRVAAQQVDAMRAQGRQGFGFAFGQGEIRAAERDRQRAAAAALQSQKALRASSAELAAEQNRLRSAQAALIPANRNYAASAKGAAAATTSLNTAIAATTVRARAAAVGMRALSGTMAFFGGPIGLAITGISLALLYTAQNSARAAQKGQEYVDALTAQQREALGLTSTLDQLSEGYLNTATAAAKLREEEKARAAQADAKAYMNDLISLAFELQQVTADFSFMDLFGDLDNANQARIQELTRKFLDGEMQANDFAEAISEVALEVRDIGKYASAINQLVGQLQGAEAVAANVASRIRGISDALAEVGKTNAVVEGLAKMKSGMAGLEEELANSKLSSTQKAIVRETERLNKEYNVGKDIAADYAERIVKNNEAVKEGEKAARKAARGHSAAAKAAGTLSEKLAELEQRAAVGFLSDLDREAVSTAQSINVAAADVQRFIDAATSGKLQEAPAVMLRIRDALQAIATEERARDLIEETATATEKLKKKQEELSAVVAKHPELAGRAQQAFADYALSLDEFSWINDASQAVGDFLKSAITDAENLDEAFENLVKRLGEIALQAFVIEPLMRSLSRSMAGFAGGGIGGGVGGAGGGIGGFFSNILGGLLGGGGGGGGLGSVLNSAFAGMYADGGFIPPGKWAITGEEGPEIVTGGRTGATVTPEMQGGQTINQTWYIKSEDPNAYRYSKRQIMRQARRGLGQG
jgi:tape measure domain-containing protein